MQIESDRAELLSGVRLGETLGSPVAMLIWNRDWENWTVAMSHDPPAPDVNPKALRPHYLPRPGHADLVGALKYDRRDVRDVLERASARETAARVACGAVAKRLLGEFDIAPFLHPLRYPAEDLWYLAGARGIVHLRSHLVGITMGQRAIRFDFELELTEP